MLLFVLGQRLLPGVLLPAGPALVPHLAVGGAHVVPEHPAFGERLAAHFAPVLDHLVVPLANVLREVALLPVGPPADVALVSRPTEVHFHFVLLQCPSLAEGGSTDVALMSFGSPQVHHLDVEPEIVTLGVALLADVALVPGLSEVNCQDVFLEIPFLAKVFPQTWHYCLGSPRWALMTWTLRLPFVA